MYIYTHYNEGFLGTHYSNDDDNDAANEYNYIYDDYNNTHKHDYGDCIYNYAYNYSY